jgi:hypothetical protein
MLEVAALAVTAAALLAGAAMTATCRRSFRLLAGLALRRFLIRLAALHLTKNALALHLLL